MLIPNSNNELSFEMHCKLISPWYSESCTDGCIVRVPPVEVLDQRDDAGGHTHNHLDVHLGGHSTTVIVIVTILSLWGGAVTYCVSVCGGRMM